MVAWLSAHCTLIELLPSATGPLIPNEPAMIDAELRSRSGQARTLPTAQCAAAIDLSNANLPAGIDVPRAMNAGFLAQGLSTLTAKSD
jgi:hypothetical protein